MNVGVVHETVTGAVSEAQRIEASAVAASFHQRVAENRYRASAESPGGRSTLSLLFR